MRVTEYQLRRHQFIYCQYSDKVSKFRGIHSSESPINHFHPKSVTSSRPLVIHVGKMWSLEVKRELLVSQLN